MINIYLFYGGISTKLTAQVRHHEHHLGSGLGLADPKRFFGRNIRVNECDLYSSALEQKARLNSIVYCQSSGEKPKIEAEVILLGSGGRAPGKSSTMPTETPIDDMSEEKVHRAQVFGDGSEFSQGQKDETGVSGDGRGRARGSKKGQGGSGRNSGRGRGCGQDGKGGEGRGRHRPEDRAVQILQSRTRSGTSTNPSAYRPSYAAIAAGKLQEEASA